jgi:molybdopterin synthase sulfur carrier subunit
MTVKAKFFAYFRDLFGGREKEVEVGPGRSVRDLLHVLCDTPARREEVFAGENVKPHLVVMINGVHIRALEGLDTKLSSGDTVAVFPFLIGG